VKGARAVMNSSMYDCEIIISIIRVIIYDDRLLLTCS